MSDQTDKKIDELAGAVSRGFTQLEGRIDAIDNRLATIESTSAAKQDLTGLKEDIDIMLDRHIGTFRKDYDELATRVKKLEEAVFKG